MTFFLKKQTLLFIRFSQFFLNVFHDFFKKQFFHNWPFFQKIPTNYIMCINLVTLVVSSGTRAGVESGLFYHKTRLHKIVLAEQYQHQLCNLSLKYSWCLQANGGNPGNPIFSLSCRDSNEVLTRHFIFSLTSVRTRFFKCPLRSVWNPSPSELGAGRQQSFDCIVHSRPAPSSEEFFIVKFKHKMNAMIPEVP